MRVAAADRAADIASAPPTVRARWSCGRDWIGSLSYREPGGKWANAKLRGLAKDLERHLGMVLHRLLAPLGSRGRTLSVAIIGTPVEVWDLFGPEKNKLE